jgi:hypothetical protein
MSFTPRSSISSVATEDVENGDSIKGRDESMAAVPDIMGSWVERTSTTPRTVSSAIANGAGNKAGTKKPTLPAINR